MRESVSQTDRAGALRAWWALTSHELFGVAELADLASIYLIL